MASKRLILHTTGINYAIWSRVNKVPGINLSTDNLTAVGTTAGMVWSTISVVSGTRRYWEVTSNSTPTAGHRVGIVWNTSDSLTSAMGATASQWALESISSAGGQLVNNGTLLSNGYASESYTIGDIIGIALDLVGNSLQFYKNGTACGTSVTVTGLENYYAGVSCGTSGSFTANFGATPFTYSVPAGFTGGIY